jgi:hypothetical protein
MFLRTWPIALVLVGCARAPIAAEAPRPRSPFEEPGDPFSGAQKAPGTIVEIPRARGFVVAAPAGWRAEKDAANGSAVLVPPNGTAKVLVAAESSDPALDQRVTRFLQESMTREETWQSEKETRVGAAGLSGFFLRGIGYQGFPGGRREPHKVLRVRIPTDVKEGNGTLVVQVLAVWNGADVETEVEIVEAVKGIQRR